MKHKREKKQQAEMSTSNMASEQTLLVPTGRAATPRHGQSTSSRPYRTLALVFASSLLLLLSTTSTNKRTAMNQAVHALQANSVVFAVIGDWGRHGLFNQDITAKGLSKAISTLPETQFIFSAGDNFYDYGVDSVTDPQFQQSFEQVYKYQNLKNLPWYIVLGNHDHRGSAKAQILYSHISKRWNLPSRYYSLWLSPNIMAIFLDTTPFSDSREGRAARIEPFVNPQRQLQWLSNTLRSAHEECRFFVMGHHNMYSVSVADHQGEVAVRDAIEPILKRYSNRIIAYVAGHEHSLMHMKPGHGYDHFVSGAGSEIRPIIKPLATRAKHWLDCCNVLAEIHDNNSTNHTIMPHTAWSASVNGFFVFRIDDNTFTATAYDMDSNILYKHQRQLPSPQ